MAKFSVIIAAAGKSTRFRDPHYKKPFALLNQKAIWLYSAEKFLSRSDVAQVIVVISSDDREDFMSRFGANVAVMGIDVVIGGAERFNSIERGLAKVADACDHVVIHDGARPCLADEWIEEVMAAGVQSRAAILATPVTSTIKKSTDGKFVGTTVSREHLWFAQTPQVFAKDLLLEAFAKRDANLVPTDEAQLVESLGHPVRMVLGSPLNVKITTKADLSFASACLKSLPTPKFDAPIHPFSDDSMWR
ncbi:MAG: 2-C-methyl-D-erythritol 4-phosphate cytidylyltransferase [Pirellulaceae bacterium]|nr:2-C-methyl-D-erythritol 4-phosphate cytidylyltransferase [Pirellulaceae bacterium]